jgi:hypothetical protein
MHFPLPTKKNPRRIALGSAVGISFTSAMAKRMWTQQATFFHLRMRLSRTPCCSLPN